jgi:hypothetical protein
MLSYKRGLIWGLADWRSTLDRLLTLPFNVNALIDPSYQRHLAITWQMIFQI